MCVICSFFICKVDVSNRYIRLHSMCKLWNFFPLFGLDSVLPEKWLFREKKNIRFFMKMVSCGFKKISFDLLLAFFFLLQVVISSNIDTCNWEIFKAVTTSTAKSNNKKQSEKEYSDKKMEIMVSYPDVYYNKLQYICP